MSGFRLIDNNMTSIVVTGANGFVGRALCDTLLDKGYTVREAVRRNIGTKNSIISSVAVGEINSKTDWSVALRSIDAVIHLAARVHVMNEFSKDPLVEFRKINVDGTLNIARQAAKNGVKRFIYISSIKVNGELTRLDMPFKEDDKFYSNRSICIIKIRSRDWIIGFSQENKNGSCHYSPTISLWSRCEGKFLFNDEMVE